VGDGRRLLIVMASETTDIRKKAMLVKIKVQKYHHSTDVVFNAKVKLVGAEILY